MLEVPGAHFDGITDSLDNLKAAVRFVHRNLHQAFHIGLGLPSTHGARPNHEHGVLVYAGLNMSANTINLLADDRRDHTGSPLEGALVGRLHGHVFAPLLGTLFRLSVIRTGAV